MAAHSTHQPIESFATHPSRYRHWQLAVDGSVATLTMDIEEGNGLRPDDYQLKQNSYDLGVDLELSDAVERLRFEHPAVRTVVLTSGQPKVFCAGANIRMLATSTHGFKVNFCRFTNETRCGIEDASAHSGQRYLAALNGTAAGGGYELALAADKMVLIDDGSSVVSLPEVPLLGVLPGTGGLTRLVDKRGVRRDLADVFCTKAEGFRARDAKKAGLIDGVFARSKWAAGVAQLAAEMAAESPARATEGIELTPLAVEVSDDGKTRSYSHVELRIDPDQRVAHLTVRSPTAPAPDGEAGLRAEGASTWSLAAYRQMDDALLHLRFNHDTVGLILIRAEGEADAVIAHDAVAQGDGWLATEIRLFQARVLRRFDNTARSTFAIIDEGTCFAGSLLETAFAADRSYMLEDEDEAVTIRATAASGGFYPMSTGLTRLQARFIGTPDAVGVALEHGGALPAPEAFDLGLVTLAPDDIDWEDEVRIGIEERVSLSPDALTGMEQNLRFVGRETCDTKIFGRLSAWQNWIFQRPNAVGEEGALTLYGHPTRPRFDWRRT
jgi:benzoyl-CoA-dihydrodiol lyase